MTVTLNAPAAEGLPEIFRAAGCDYRERVSDALDYRRGASAGKPVLPRDGCLSPGFVDAAAVHDVLLSIYRPMQPQPAQAMRLTFSLDLLLFRAGRY